MDPYLLEQKLRPHAMTPWDLWRLMPTEFIRADALQVGDLACWDDHNVQVIARLETKPPSKQPWSDVVEPEIWIYDANGNIYSTWASCEYDTFKPSDAQRSELIKSVQETMEFWKRQE